jgi:hypothetical protein
MRTTGRRGHKNGLRPCAATDGGYVLGRRYSFTRDDDMMSAMARELVERGRVGELADAVWQISTANVPAHATDACGVADGVSGRGRSIVASSVEVAGSTIATCAASRRLEESARSLRACVRL